MIEIGHKRLRTVRIVQVDAKGKRRLVPKIENGEPVTKLVANEPVRVTRGGLNGHFGPHNGCRLVAKLKDGDVLELRPQGRRLGAFSATLFDIYMWMVKSAADRIKMAKLRDIKAKKEMARLERNARRPVKG